MAVVLGGSRGLPWRDLGRTLGEVSFSSFLSFFKEPEWAGTHPKVRAPAAGQGTGTPRATAGSARSHRSCRQQPTCPPTHPPNHPASQALSRTHSATHPPIRMSPRPNPPTHPPTRVHNVTSHHPHYLRHAGGEGRTERRLLVAGVLLDREPGVQGAKGGGAEEERDCVPQLTIALAGAAAQGNHAAGTATHAWPSHNSTCGHLAHAQACSAPHLWLEGGGQRQAAKQVSGTRLARNLHWHLHGVARHCRLRGRRGVRSAGRGCSAATCGCGSKRMDTQRLHGTAGGHAATRTAADLRCTSIPPTHLHCRRRRRCQQLVVLGPAAQQHLSNRHGVVAAMVWR